MKYKEEELIPAKCKKCGNKACICGGDNFWAAHCTFCEQAIGHIGYHDPCAKSELDAVKQWNELNKI